MSSDPKHSGPHGRENPAAGAAAGIGHGVIRPALHRLWHMGREYLTHWAVAGLIVTATGVAPDHWVAHLIDTFHVPAEAVHLWAANLDFRWLAVALGLTLIVSDIAWRRARPHASAPLEVAVAAAPGLPDKPSIAVLPFTNLSDDPAGDFFADGLTEDIITELSRFHALLVISRNSVFTYKGKPADVRQIARELSVHYVVEGSVRKSGNRARVSAQLVDATTGRQDWAEHYDRTLDDVFALQEEITRGIVAAVAPEIEQAEMAHARTALPNETAQHLTWRAQGLMNEGVRQGLAAPLLEAITLARQAVEADPSALAAFNVLAWCNWSCHLYRWGAEPEKALDRMTDAVARMSALNPLDHRTLTVSGIVRTIKGEPDRGIADLRRAVEVNPNAAQSLMWLAMCEAMAGLHTDARAHADLSLRLNPRETWVGVAHVALALVSFAAHDYQEAARLAELAIQSEPAVPLRRAILIACCTRLGDTARAAREMATLEGFAPDFIPGLFRGEFKVFRQPEAMAHLLDSLRMAQAT